MVKKMPTVRETWVGSLGQEDPPEEGIVTHCSILAWRMPMAEDPGEQVHGVTDTGLFEQLAEHAYIRIETFTTSLVVQWLRKDLPASAGDTG